MVPVVHLDVENATVPNCDGFVRNSDFSVSDHQSQSRINSEYKDNWILVLTGKSFPFLKCSTLKKKKMKKPCNACF